MSSTSRDAVVVKSRQGGELATAVYIGGLVYACLLALGGVAGYSRKGSQESLVAGLISAALVFTGAFLIHTGNVLAGACMVTVVAALLSVRFGVVFSGSGWIFMPAGLVTLCSLVMLGLSVTLIYGSAIRSRDKLDD